MKSSPPLQAPLLVPTMPELELKQEVIRFCNRNGYEFLRLNHEVGTLVVRATSPQADSVILKFQHNRLKTNDRDLAEVNSFSSTSHLPNQELARERVLLSQLCYLDFIPQIKDSTQYNIPQQYGAPLALEDLGEQTLADALDKPAMTISHRIGILKQIAHIIKKLHAERFAHTDLDLGNIMLCDEQVKIIDFGVSKPIIGSPKKARARKTLSCVSTYSFSANHSQVKFNGAYTNVTGAFTDYVSFAKMAIQILCPIADVRNRFTGVIERYHRSRLAYFNKHLFPLFAQYYPSVAESLKDLIQFLDSILQANEKDIEPTSSWCCPCLFPKKTAVKAYVAKHYPKIEDIISQLDWLLTLCSNVRRDTCGSLQVGGAKTGY